VASAKKSLASWRTAPPIPARSPICRSYWPTRPVSWIERFVVSAPDVGGEVFW
jgi:hypothetical protein